MIADSSLFTPFGWLLALLLFWLSIFTTIVLYRQRTLNRKYYETVLSLRDAQSRLRQFSEQLPVAVFQCTLPGNSGHAARFDYVSDNLSMLLPCDHAALIADASILLDYIDPADSSGLAWITDGNITSAHIDWTGRTHKRQEPRRWLNLRAAAGVGTEGQRVVTGVIIDISLYKAALQALADSREEIRQIAAHREEQRELEYRRLAREFHDELGQVLTSARMRTNLLSTQLVDQENSRKALAEIDAMLGEAYRSVKTIAAELRPPALNLGLPAALEWLAERALAPAGIRYTQAIAPIAETLPDAVATSLFRILQEAMTNTIRYAGATLVHVSLRDSDHQLHLSISDDGCGFVPEKVSAADHFGLIGMRERVSALGGSIDIDSAPGEGTRISVTFTLSSLEKRLDSSDHR